MAGVGFHILFGLSCLLFPCEGGITSPPDGTEYIFLPGQTAKIKWEFNDAISSLRLRIWSFTSSDGSLKDKSLASISKNESTEIETKLLEVVIERPATLVLKNVNQSYAGIYQFGFTSSANFASDVGVSIAKKPTTMVNCPSRNEINEGGNFICECRSVGGIPDNNATWFKNGVQFGETRKENNTLSLKDVDETDNGTYMCVAESYANVAFRDEESIVLIVNFKPKDTSIGFTQNPATLGEPVTINCESRAFPEPSYTIIHNNTLVITETMISQVNWTHAGKYNCTATNNLGSDSDSGFLNVTEQGPPTTTPPPKTASSTSKTASTTKKVSTKPPPKKKSELSTGAIVGIIIGVLLLIIIIVVVVVYCCKSKEKERGNRADIDPVPGNHYELENEEPGPGDGAYDSVGPVGASSSKSKPPAGNTLPPVYAAVDKNNRQGNTLYASLDTEALKTSRASKKEPDRPLQAEYASIDFGKSAPKADLV